MTGGATAYPRDPVFPETEARPLDPGVRGVRRHRALRRGAGRQVAGRRRRRAPGAPGRAAAPRIRGRRARRLRDQGRVRRRERRGGRVAAAKRRTRRDGRRARRRALRLRGRRRGVELQRGGRAVRRSAVDDSRTNTSARCGGAARAPGGGSETTGRATTRTNSSDDRRVVVVLCIRRPVLSQISDEDVRLVRLMNAFCTAVSILAQTTRTSQKRATREAPSARSL